MRDGMIALRLAGISLFGLACASSLAAKSPAVAQAGDRVGWDVLLGVIAFVLGCAAAVMLVIRREKLRRVCARKRRRG